MRLSAWFSKHTGLDSDDEARRAMEGVWFRRPVCQAGV